MEPATRIFVGEMIEVVVTADTDVAGEAEGDVLMLSDSLLAKPSFS
jgi:hypothetical protein